VNIFHGLGKMFLLTGLLLVVVGLLLLFADRIPFIGRLPGDICLHKGNFTFYFPIVTCLILSILITLVLSFFRK